MSEHQIVPPTEQPKPCRDCHVEIGTVQCRCSKHHKMCNRCAARSRLRSATNEFYTEYRLWCDTCIWFDIG